MSLTEQLSQLLAEKSRQELFSGAVLVRHGGQPLLQEAYGYAHRGWRIKNQVDTRFRIASISKMFTAAAILQLVEQGDLTLDTAVIDLLNLQPAKIPPAVTIEHLLTMTAGLVDWFDESGDWEANWAALRRRHPLYLFRDNKDYLPLFVNEEPVAPAGEQYRYNNAAYILLGLAIEQVTHLSYFDYIRRYILAKAGMVDSDFLALDSVTANVAEGYMPLTGDGDQIIGWQKNIYSATPEAAADGGATSTVADLSRFIQALRAGRLLSPDLSEAMLTPHVLEDEEPIKGYTRMYGYGTMFLLDEAERVVRWGHTGEEAGVSCRLYYYPAQDIEVILLGNQSWCAGDVAWEIHDLVMGE